MMRRVVIRSESEEVSRASGTDGWKETSPDAVSTVLMHGKVLWTFTEDFERTCRGKEKRIQCSGNSIVYISRNLSDHYPDLGQRWSQITLAPVFSLM